MLKGGTYGGEGKAVGCVSLAALLFEQPSSGLCILTWIKDADCDPVVWDYEPRSRYGPHHMKKLVLVEAFALAALIVAVTGVNPQTLQVMVEASQAANGPHDSAMGKIIAFARAAGTVAILTVSPQSTKPRPH